MSAISDGELPPSRGRGLRIPGLRAPQRDGGGDAPIDRTSVVWLAYSWDMAAARLTEVAPDAEDLGPMRVTDWSTWVRQGRIVATRREGAELWGRAWRIDEFAGAVLAHRRHPAGVLELVVAHDALNRPLEVRILALRDSPTSDQRPALLEAGWALHGAAEAELPIRARRHFRGTPFRGWRQTNCARRS